MSDRDAVTDVEETEYAQEDVVVQGSEGWLANSPWWLVSTGVHVVLLLAASLYYIEKNVPIDDSEVAVVVGAKSAPAVQEIERPRDVFERRGIPKDDQQTHPTEEPAIFFPNAEESDHNESADNEEYQQMKGDSKDFLSYQRGESGGIRGRQAGPAKGVYDAMGVGNGGGSAGRYGGRFGGKFDRVARGGGTRATESAVLAALKWLARHQSPDGGWGAESFVNQCVGGKCGGAGERDYDVGVTSLSILAFLGAGYSHLSRDEYPDPANPGRVLKFGEVVKKGVQWLIAHQDPEGCVGDEP